jgi:glyoxylase-like metal-dependent hydrolase (beta-lactamase superfamily II)
VFKVGEWKVELLELGHAMGRVSHHIDLPSDVEDGPVHIVFNALLLRRSAQTVVVDTGLGVTAPVLGMPHTDMTGALAAHGVSPENVDIVCLTHLDCDHVGGAFEGTWPEELRRVFLNAEVMASAVEIDWSRKGGSGAGFEGGPVAVTALGAALVPVASGDEIAPGIHMRSAPGHTPGHMLVEIDGDPPLLYLADVLHAPFLVERPSLVIPDRDPPTGLRTRLALIEESANRDVGVLATHIPAREPARIVRAEDGYRWETH